MVRNLMKALASALVAPVAAALLAFPTGASAGHGFPKFCGSQSGVGAGWYNVEAFNVKCSTARRVAKRYWQTGDHRFNGWKCDSDGSGELFFADCKRKKHGRHQHLRFEYGS